MNFFLLLAAGAVALFGVGWYGLQRRPKSFPPIKGTDIAARIPIPNHLPKPVLRFARTLLFGKPVVCRSGSPRKRSFRGVDFKGDTMPQVSSAIVFGYVQAIFNGIPMPARFRFFYDGRGNNHYHYIQVMWFERPLITVHERYFEGKAKLALPNANIENDPLTDSAARQGFWSEVMAWLHQSFWLRQVPAGRLLMITQYGYIYPMRQTQKPLRSHSICNLACWCR